MLDSMDTAAPTDQALDARPDAPAEDEAMEAAIEEAIVGAPASQPIMPQQPAAEPEIELALLPAEPIPVAEVPAPPVVEVSVIVEQPLIARGKIDRIDNDGVAGWAYHEANPSESVIVELWDDQQLLTSSRANMPRSDVNRTFGIAGAHGYHISFPEHLYDGRKHALRVVVDGRDAGRTKAVSETTVLTRSDLQALAPALRYEGQIEGLSSGRVHGWAFDRKNPDKPVSVSVFVDDELVATVLANRYSARLRSYLRDGHQIFLAKLPLRLMNGERRNIKVVITGTDFPLPGPPNQVLFPLVDYFGQLPLPPGATDFAYAPQARAWRSSAPVRAEGPPAAPAGMPLISMIVLNLNGASMLVQLFESLQRVRWRHPFEVILVDHGSTDGSVDAARSLGQGLDLRIIERGANHSFSASNNMAARLARGRYLAFANNDLVLLHDCLAGMVDHLQDPAVGAVGLKLLEPLKSGQGRWSYITHHQGVEFEPGGKFPGKEMRCYTPMEIGERGSSELAETYLLPATTAALMVCRAEDFEQIGGFHEGYFYGMEDVDLCMTFRRKLGKLVITDTSLVALHNRSATREAKLVSPDLERRQSAAQNLANRKLFMRRHGRSVSREALASLVRGETFWRSTPLRVVFVVTEAHMSTPAGDFFTAVELAESMRRLYGWETLFATKQNYMLSGADVAIVMFHNYDVQKINDANPGLVTVAWVRNRVNEWVASPYFDAYQLIFCSSRKGIAYVEEQTGRSATLLPIATNAARFSPRVPVAGHVADMTFTGSNWSEPRDAVTWLDPEAIDFAIYGHRWNEVPQWQSYWRGAVPYTQLPDIYSSAKIVLDDSHPVTREWNSLNSRVFDALGCGKLVLTNCAGGSEELFGAELPTFKDGEQLRELALHYLARPKEREALARKLHEQVLEHHTYDNRARTFQQQLSGFTEGGALRFAIKIGVPSAAEREAWGDYHFATALQRALRRRGHFVRIDLLPDWYTGLGAGDDVVLVLRGLSVYQPEPMAINLMWMISHPDEVSLAECRGYDHVFVASEPYAQRLAVRLGDQVSTLLQCTDPELFHPLSPQDSRENSQEDSQRDSQLEGGSPDATPLDGDPGDTAEVGDVIFVGNSRGQRREVVQYALDAGIDFSVYGGQWENMLPPSRLKARHVPNRELHRYYAGAEVVLNDHWPDMRSEGFISNRIFDAGACGAAILSDDMPACRELFGDALSYYDSPASMAAAVQALKDDAPGRRARGEKLAELVRENHTFDHRADTILATVAVLMKG